MTLTKPTQSRLLDAAEKQNRARRDKQNSTVISFKDMRKGGEDDV